MCGMRKIKKNRMIPKFMSLKNSRTLIKFTQVRGMERGEEWHEHIIIMVLICRV